MRNKPFCHRASMARRLGWSLAAAAALLMMLAAWPAPARAPERFGLSAGHTSSEALPIPTVTGAVRVNSADAPALAALPGIGDALAQAILEERAAHGAFFYPEDLLTVRGIGEKKLAAMRDWLDLTLEADKP